MESSSIFVELHGTIIRKKKRQNWLVLAVKQEGKNSSVHAYLSRKEGATVEGLDQVLGASAIAGAHFLYLQATVLVRGFLRTVRVDSADQEGGSEEEERLFVDHISLLKCAPEPTAIEIVLRSIARRDGEFHPDVLYMPSKAEEIDSAQEDAVQILSLPQRQRRLAIARLVRRLQGMETLERSSRSRLPHTRLHELRILDEIESHGRCQQASWKLVEPETIRSPTLEANFLHYLPLNLPAAEPCADVESTLDVSQQSSSQIVSCRGNQTRIDYLVMKKHPQVKWMCNRVCAILADLGEDIARVTHIIDVGGGRGDLATALAFALPNSVLTVVDRNQQSLERGREYARRLGLLTRMYFIQADFRAFTRDPYSFYEAEANITCAAAPSSVRPPPINMVVALHACGDLSDMALSFAQQLLCPFVICPCCYTKQIAVDDFQPAWWRHLRPVVPNAHTETICDDRPRMASVLGRLAELNERPEVSRRAMAVINSMRLQCFAIDKSNLYSLSLEEYENTSSMRNTVLVGSTG
jgi:hypothetical protein